jgi:hypothetical protein
MSGHANPSQNPADLGTLAGTLRTAFRKLMESTDGMLPATVVAVDAKREYAAVQLQVMIEATDGTLTRRDQIQAPILTMGAGGFVMSFPLAAGDFGWVFAADRDTSLVLQTGKESGPNTYIIKDFASCVFIPDAARRWVLSGDDADAAVWQSNDGAVKIALSPGKIRVVHPTKVEIVSPTVTMSGDLQVQGTVTATTDCVGDGKSLKDHVHSGVTAGGANTGKPV